jgi:DNA-binding IclR family transcriptional regulator
MQSETHEFLARQPAAVDSAFAVLEAVARMGPGVTARQLTEALPMSRASVYRIIKHLVANEYLVRTPDLRGFVIGERVRALSGAAVTEPVLTKPR